MDIRARAARDAKIFQRLNEEWTFDTMRLDGHRGFFTVPGKSEQLRMSGEYMFKGWKRFNGEEWDFRITKKFSTFMFQWRTSIKKGQRIILKEYSSGNSRDVVFTHDVPISSRGMAELRSGNGRYVYKTIIRDPRVPFLFLPVRPVRSLRVMPVHSAG